MEKRPLYAYENLIANANKDTDKDLLVFAVAATHLAQLIKDKGKDVALLNGRHRLYSALHRLQFLERNIAYHTSYGHLPVFPELQVLGAGELKKLQAEYDNQFQTQGG